MSAVPAGFRTTASGYAIDLDRREAEVLVSLASDSGRLITANPEFVSLLTPDAYPDDPDASDEFARYTSDDLGRARVAELALLQAAPLDGGDFLVTAAEADDVLRGLGFLRLLLSDSAGEPDAESPEDSSADESRPMRSAVSQWLAWLQESLIAALDGGAAADE
ncbi:DUF2017 family protein [Mycetocola reblochoni]|uniref:Uncharacterized protein n=2 Tax=Mycetocola reblochoni TaxID=331618 RepID=A0A1R4K805_9MICO|nr:DUF2017 family protein [Mycetocola reblochoni]RLP67830.1 DUF2017 family protein [Mycetocola reblochoni]SJN40416.1 hypothetical protein FM119_11950 [Mycetocola reblochoni REB411]